MLILGIDDAGRGPLIGPMILAGVLLDKTKENFLKKNNVKDSKLLGHSERVRIAKIIKESAENFEVVTVLPEEIDDAILFGKNLNTLEAMKMAAVINKINSGKFSKEKIRVILDCPSVNIAAWQRNLESFVSRKDNLTITCEHKADLNHVVVGAASILAKVAREDEVARIKKQHGDIGSGYPSDPYTKEFLRKRGKELANSGIFRKSWATWKEIFPTEEKKQKSLSDF